MGSELKTATISFAAPDADWRSTASGLALNVYLYRVTENRELRSNDRRLQSNGDGTVTLALAPARVECSYVVTAWNHVTPGSGGPEPEAQAHRLLSQALFVLMRNPSVPRFYLVGLAAQAIEPP